MEPAEPPAPGKIEMPRARLIESVISILVIALAAGVIFEASKLPPGSFDPLGSGTMPAVTAWVLIVLSLAVLIRPLIANGTAGQPAPPEEVRPDGTTAWRAVFLAGSTLAYVVALDQEVAHFITITIVFLMASLLVLNGLSFRGVAISLAVSLVFPILLFLCFTKIFVVDLPGAF